MRRASLAIRSHEPEILDARDCLYEEYKQALSEVAFINRLTASYHLFTKAIRKFALMADGRPRPLKILEVGFGSGDLLRYLHTWGQRQGLLLDLAGIDLDPWAKRMAEEETPRTMAIEYRTGNVFGLNPSEQYAVIISSFFTHHLPEADLVKFLAWMNETAKIGWFLHDIHRHPIAYYSTKWIVQLLRFCPIVVNDAPLSVARSFTRKDWEGVLNQLPPHDASIEVDWCFPFKYCLLGTKRSDEGV